jgi:hypothetical protein
MADRTKASSHPKYDLANCSWQAGLNPPVIPNIIAHFSWQTELKPPVITNTIF